MVTIPTTEPKRFRIGDTLKFKRYFADFPPDAYTLGYVFTNDNYIYSFDCTDNGDGSHLANVATTQTTSWRHGEYTWQAYMTSAGERYSVGTGIIELLPDLTKGAIDDRTHVKRTLDAIEATLEKRASSDQLSYSINGRSLSRTPIEELVKLHSHYKQMYKRELQTAELNNGRGRNNVLRVRFNG